MNIKKVWIAAVFALGGAAFICGNAYAAPLTVKIDDADFYSALKTCVNEGMSYTELWTNGGEVGAINNMGCGSFDGATFDDSTTSITFANEADINNVGYLYMPNMGIKNIQDLSKFPQVRDINLAHNDIEDATVPGWDAAYAEEVDLSIALSDNKLKEVPSYITDIQSLEDKIDFFTTKGIDQNLVGEYSDGSYTLPESLIQYREALAEYSALASNFSNGSYAHDVASYYSPDNWLVLENATLSSDGRSISPINPSRNMVISYKKSWNELTANAPMFNLCDYAENADLCEGADMQAYIDYQKSYYNAFQSSSEELNLITLTVRSNNATDYGDDAFVINIEDPTFYAAVKDCIRNHSMTPDDFWDSMHNSEVEFLLTTTVCVGLDDALFNDNEMAIIFEDGEDFKSRTNNFVILPNANITSISDAFKFSKVSDNLVEYATGFYLINGDLANLGEIDNNELIILYGAMILPGNKIRDINIDSMLNFVDEYAVEYCNEHRCEYGVDIEKFNTGMQLLVRLFELNLVNQNIEDDYSGEKYYLPETIKSVVKYLEYMSTFYQKADDLISQDDSIASQLSQSEIENINRYKEIFGNYYNPDDWLVLENATLSDDGEYLIPIDPSKDMSISFKRDWDTVSQMDQDSNNFYRYLIGSVEDLKLLEGNSDYYTLASLTVHYTASNPNTLDNIKLIGALTVVSTLISGAYVYRKVQR